jgi:asparagine synthetase B (glutamine-hydrolysing)
MIAFLNGISTLIPEHSRQYKKALNLSFLSDSELLFSLSAYLTESEKQTLFKRDFLNKLNLRSGKRFFLPFEKRNGKDDDALSISKILFQLSLPSDMFKKVDMMSMLAGIEVRVPLLHEPLTTFALSLPESYKLKGKKGKYILRELLKKKLPSEIVDKKKSGFAIPLDKLVNPAMMTYIREKLQGDNSHVAKICNEKIIASWIDAFEGKIKINGTTSREGIYQRIFMLLSLEIWLKKYHFEI